MAGTLGDMKSRVANELARADLTSQIANAITDAINIYQTERFRFSETVPGTPQTFNTVDGQWIYTSAANANIPTILKFDYVNYTLGTTLWQLQRETPEFIRLSNQNANIKGQPIWYGIEGQQLLLSPIPNGVWLMTLGAFFNKAAPASDSETGNVWMTGLAELLIRSRAKYEIAVHVTRDQGLAARMSPDAPGLGERAGATYSAWKRLKSDANRYTGTGRIRAMAF